MGKGFYFKIPQNNGIEYKAVLYPYRKDSKKNT